MYSKSFLAQYRGYNISRKKFKKKNLFSYIFCNTRIAQYIIYRSFKHGFSLVGARRKPLYLCNRVTKNQIGVNRNLKKIYFH